MLVLFLLAFAATLPAQNPVPQASIDGLGDIFIGEDFTFTVSFDNTANATPDPNVGYGPYIDLVFPTNGADGNAGMDTPDGPVFVSASYLGASLPLAQATAFPASGVLDHPLAVDNTGAPIQVTGTEGDVLVVLQLPFGSFVPDQPAAPITVNASLSNLADLGTPLTFSATAGFQFGNDPLDNPATDPSIIQASPTTSDLTPILIELVKIYNGPEDETATGPNFTRSYTIQVDVANGQEVTNLDVTDLLPNNMAYVQVVPVPSGNNTGSITTIEEPAMGVPSNAPNNELTLRYDTVTGTAGAVDAEYSFQFFIPLDDANGQPVLPAVSADDRFSSNTALAVGDWAPIDTRDAGGTDNAVADPVGLEHVLEDQANAIQKGVTIFTDTGVAGPSPGDVLLYTIDFQISDYFAFENIVITDITSDGQRFDTSFTPTLSYAEHASNSVAASFASANFDVIDRFTGGSPAVPPIDGSQEYIFRVSDELAGRPGQDGQLIGGSIPAGGTGGPRPNPVPTFGGTTGQIQFRTIIQDVFTDDFPSGDDSVDERDVLTNSAVIDGDVLNVADLTPNGQTEDDDTGASVQIVEGELFKSIYAINGDTDLSNFMPTMTNGLVELRPGDVVTYRLEYTLPIADIEDLNFIDYLPLPVFETGNFNLTFDNTVDANVPPAQSAKFGPDDTFFAISGITPTVTRDSVGNIVEFFFGDYDNPTIPPPTARIDILLSVEVLDDPFADRLFLTNQARVELGSTNNGDNQLDAIIQIILTQPELRITKGIIATNSTAPNAAFNPAQVGPATFTPNGVGANPSWSGTVDSNGLAMSPIDSNLTGLDAASPGDIVTFAIVIENIGSSTRGAFDITVEDALPAGFDYPGGNTLNANVQVRNGNGDGIGTSTTISPTDGITVTLTDSNAPTTGAITGFVDGSSRTNIAIITFDLEVTSIEANELLTNTATLTNYAGVEGGDNFVPDGLSDDATVRNQPVEIDKSITGTDEIHTSGNNVAIGETIEYTVVLTIPEGTNTNAVFTDLLDAGLVHESVLSVTPNSGTLSTDVAGSFFGVLTNAALSNSDRTLTLDFGNLTNSARSDGVAETITIVYEVRVADIGASFNGRNRNNRARWNSDFQSGGTVQDNAPNATIREPFLNITKTGAPDSGLIQNDTVTYTVQVDHTNASATDAFDLVIDDLIDDPRINFVPGSVTAVANGPGAGSVNPVITSGNGGSDTTIVINADTLPLTTPETTIDITYQATVDPAVFSGDVIPNTVDLSWDTLPGDDDPNERDYTDDATETVEVELPDLLKVVAGTSASNTGTSEGLSPTFVDLTIGEIVTYDVTLTFIEGNTTETVFTDFFPNDTDNGTVIRADSAQLFSIGANLSFNPDMAIFSDRDFDSINDTVVIDFGTVINSDTDMVVDPDDQVVVRLTGTVMNLAANANNDQAVNTAQLDFNVGQTTNRLTGTATVDIVRPELNITKTATNVPVPVGFAGDIIEYTLEVSHTGNSEADAFDLTISDPLAAEIQSTGDVTIVTSAPTSPTIVINDGDTDGDTSISVTLSALPLGETATITFRTRVLSTLPFGTNIDNTASVTGDTLLGDMGEGDHDQEGETTDDDNERVTVDIPTIGDFVWNDLNGDGIQDGGEPGIDGVSIELWRDENGDMMLDAGDTFIGRQLTGGGGAYDFVDLVPGDFIVIVTDDDDVLEGFGLTGGVEPRPVTVAAGDDFNDADFGYQQQDATIGDFVWSDADNDGLQDPGEVGIEGVTLDLYIDTNGSGTIDGGDVLTSTTITDPDGGYLFANLPRGDYLVDVTDTGAQLNGFALTTMLDPFPVTGLMAGENFVLADFGYFSTDATASIGDFVWEDIDGDTIQDAGEPGIVSVTLDLIDDLNMNGAINTGEPVIATVATDAAGRYDFTGLPAGDYIVDVTDINNQLASYVSTTLNDPFSVHALANGQNFEDADFGYRRDLALGSIGDFVWLDANGDGVQDPGEPGIGGVTLELRDSGNNFLTSTTTLADGSYIFPGLSPDIYSVDVTDDNNVLAGFTRTTPAVVPFVVPLLTPGQHFEDADFGYQPPAPLATIGDFVWEDLDGDGVQDGSEPGIPGVTVDLILDLDGDGFVDPEDLTVASTETDMNGAYDFTGVPAGNYIVTVSDNGDVLDGFVQTGGDDPAIVPGISGNDDFNDADFGYQAIPSALGDFVWEDVNANGIQDGGEMGIGGVTVNLLSGTGTPTGMSTLTATADGSYSFTGLDRGDYIVEFILPDASWAFSPQDQGGDDAVDSDANPNAGPNLGRTAVVNLSAGETNLTVDAGMFQPIILGDFVWDDLDGDGIQDGGEPGIDGVTVELLNASGDAVSTATTMGGGAYSFTILVPGTYSVRFSNLPANYVFTFDNQGGDDGVDSDADRTTGETAQITVASGDTIDNIDAGAYLPVSVGDFVWHDLNGNGIQDGGEPGLDGVDVVLNIVSGLQTAVPSMTTAGGGAYGFTNLAPGTYSVTFSNLPTDFVFAFDDQGGDDSVDSDADRTTGTSSNTTLNSGDPADNTLDAGAYLPVSLGNFVWEDIDGDGIQDAGEPAIQGVTAALNVVSGLQPAVSNETTDINGAYSFTDLAPGEYSVTFSNLPVNFVFTFANQGGDDAIDSDADTTTGTTGSTVLDSGESDETLDAGAYVPVAIGDFFWDDLNGSGVQDAGEPGIDGVTVALNVVAGLQPTVAPTVTAGGGAYAFTGLAPGTYSVTFSDLPTSYILTFANVGDDTEDSDADRTTSITPSVTVTSGRVDNTLDAGAFIPVGIGDFVWEDFNFNGLQDVGDLGVPGTLVQLNVVSGLQPGVPAQTTLADGSYLFDNLAPGTYTVTFTEAPGYLLTIPNQGSDDAIDSDPDIISGVTPLVVLQSGDGTTTTVDAGMYTPTLLGDFVWEDRNGNGIQDAGEPGIDDVLVELLDQNGDLLTTTTTIGGGSYMFTNLDPGTYSVRFNLPDGFVFTFPNEGGDDTEDSDADRTTGETQQVTIISQELNNTLDAGMFRPVSIGNFVWDDLNGDGDQDAGEPGIENVSVDLTVVSGLQAAVPTTTTLSDGSYLFDGLAPGTYRVTFSNLPSTYVFTFFNQAGDDLIDSDANRTTGEAPNTSLSSGQSDLTIDAGAYRPVTVGSQVWHDLNGDGIFDIMRTEPGIENVTVELNIEGGLQTAVAPLQTDSDGLYFFRDLAPGTYSVTFSNLPTDFVFTFSEQGVNETIDSDADRTTGRTPATTLQSGEVDPTLDAGAYLPVSVGDFVWDDLNGDGIQDGGEPGIGGVSVRLNVVNGLQPAVADITTSPGGTYSFTGLAPGEYSVTFFGLPGDYVFTFQDQGGDDAVDSDADRTLGLTGSTLLASGESDDTLDAGAYFPVSVGNFVWDDLDGDGIQDAGEPGIDGVSVDLSVISGLQTPVSNTFTTSGGLYLFSGLAPGEYAVTFSGLPVGYVFTFDNEGADDTLDSDADRTTGATASTGFLNSGSSDLTLDAGAYVPVAVGDFVWEDTNGDGTQTGESGIDGVTVSLNIISGLQPAVSDVVTTGGGAYVFSDLAPGEYSVTFSNLPANYVFTFDNEGGDDQADSDADRTTGTTPSTILTSGTSDPTLDAGVYIPVNLGNFVWEDSDGDGIQNFGSSGVSNVGVNLEVVSGLQPTVPTETTDMNGMYSFNDLAPGQYAVTFIGLPFGSVFTFANEGSDDALDSDADRTTGRTDVVTLFSGQDDLTVDAGVYFPVAVGDFVWDDLNRNGIQDDGEPGVGDVTVSLTTESGLQTAVADVVTSPDGAYLFTGLAPGSYSVTFSDLPAGYAFTLQDQGGDNAADSDADILTGATAATPVLSSGSFDFTLDAGIVLPVRIGDFVFEDRNGDGIQDDGEPGIPGVVVTLLDDMSNEVAVTTTSLTGNYLFPGLDPGTTYTVVFTTPDQFIVSPMDAGTSDTLDSDIDPMTGAAPPVRLVSGGENLNIDAGFIPVRCIGGVVFNDVNESWFQDPGEPGFANVTLELYLDLDGDHALEPGEPLLASTTTDSDGVYRFDDLRFPASYLVVATDENNVLDGFFLTFFMNPYPVDIITGDEVPATCDAQNWAYAVGLDDEFENNDDKAWSSPLVLTGPTTIFNDLVLMPEDEDWYRIDMANVANLQIVMDFEHDLGNLQLQLFDWRSSPDDIEFGTVVGESFTDTDQEQISYVNLTNPDFLFLRVYEENRLGNPNYSLTITVMDMATGFDDQFDMISALGNDHPCSPDLQTLADGVQYQNLISRDDDWYRIDVAGKDTLDVRMDHYFYSGNLHLMVTAHEPNLCDSTFDYVIGGGFSDIPLQPELITGLDVSAYNEVYLRVYGANRAANFYDLLVETSGSGTTRGIAAATGGGESLESASSRAEVSLAASTLASRHMMAAIDSAAGGGIADDALENNDSPAEASPVNLTSDNSRVLTDLTLNDEDWYAITLGARRHARITAIFDHAAGDLQIQLFDWRMVQGGEWGRVVGEDYGDTNQAEITYVNITDPQTLYLRVYGEGGATNPAYSLDFDVTDFDDVFEIVTDEYEFGTANDYSCTAPPTLDVGTSYQSLICRDDDWYRFNVSGIDYIDIRADHYFHSGNLHLMVAEDNGADCNAVYSHLIAGSFSNDPSTNAEVIERLDVRDHDTILLRVYGATRNTNYYDLLVTPTQ
jgi:fimbrial isopeptide formation D2 family protein/uncharacterized repeat protein (TIGR01451 family)